MVVKCTPYLLALVVSVLVTPEPQAQSELPHALDREIDFATEIHPLLAENCFQCHHGNKRRGGLHMGSREELIQGGETGPAIVPGDSAASYLVKLTVGLEDGLRMPPKGAPLSDEQIALLRGWIDQGAKWELDLDQESAYQLPLKPRRPQLPKPESGIHPVDQFLEQYFTENNVEPTDPVSDRLFLRRAHLDTIGLPPSPEQLAAFENDKDPNKRAKVVRQLLADNQGYAEHWMTFWNDALRNDYTGTGYIDGGRKQITGWLYDSLYYNLPYDQFVTQLISPTPESQGFIKGINWRGDANSSQLPHMQAAQNVSQVFMGVNLKCASCHDSFVNQWQLSDAYGLAAVFTEEPLEMVRCDKPTGKMAEAKFLYPELGTIQGDVPPRGRAAQLARLVTDDDNGRFARTIVNRIWAEFFGRGLVEPLDDLDAKPWNADILDWLAVDFVDHGYDLRHLMARILTSKAYQLPIDHAYDKDEDYVFRGPLARRLSAEQFLDSIYSITGVWGEDNRFNVPHESDQYRGKVRAWRAASTPLTKALGRPSRDQVVLRREEQPTTLQSLEINNGEVFYNLLQRATNGVPGIRYAAPEHLTNMMYRRALLREPTAEEKAVALELLGQNPTRESLADLLWAIVLLPEFQYIH